MKLNEARFHSLLKILTDIGISLSAEKNHTRLLELILQKALEITNADGGTIYTCTDNKELKFEILMNKSLNLYLGGSSGHQASFSDLPLYDENGKPNSHMLAPWAAISKKTINIKNAYSNRTFDLSGTKKFDKSIGYHSQSFLTVPMTNHLNEVIGVLQLINALNPKTYEIVPFSKLDQTLIESMASQAAVTITNRNLIEAEKRLFDALIQLIAKAIDEKSPYTGGHCRRVPVISSMLAQATCRINKGPLKNFSMTEDELYELEVASWLHDCGKITTPEAVVDKATKLEVIMDGICLVDTRFEILKRDKTIARLLQQFESITGKPFLLETDEALQSELRILEEEREVIRRNNIGGERILPEALEQIKKIGQHTLIGSLGQKEQLLTQKEIELLSIARGTLSNDERDVINNHVSMSIKMLESLPYPKRLKNVPQLAGSHHEKMDGTGYPRGLKREDMSLQARMIAIADVFEALTARDRPYKKSMPLQQALSVLGQMKLDGHIDPDLFDVFMNEEIYVDYAKEYLDPTALINLDLSKVPGFVVL